ncbi:PLP-dependent aspartate aminotransferase family protein [Stappia stellulata]|uniref:trans-sulfuration enzyme family protein n=1 Tax=Stappia stellulata TaxID=71235 RepID=UPI001CD45867|nr:PLP-dependent aspartate aminotransferase family protein [Stappia stellulata]MCA1241018.1 PLP-dependent aspartate aminotransferase family protein [Stappia stellulata]
MSKTSKSPLHPASLLAHGGGGVDPATGAVVPPIQPATTFARDAEYRLISDTHLYARDDNDLVRQIESLIVELEGAADSRLFASGMAAIAATVRTVKPGGTILVQSGIYWGTTSWLRKHCDHAGIALIEADAADTARFCETLVESGPSLVLIETPSNPWLTVADIAPIAEAAKTVGATVAVDATAATPLLMRPLALGADLVIHSATKALNGHSDVLAGLVSCRDADSAAWSFIRTERHDAGAILSSFDAYLLLRGLRTLALRMERMCANAQTIAETLAAHPAVETVLYPGLADHPSHDRAKAQMHGGYGYLMSVMVKGGGANALAVAGRLELIKRATSLGGVESLVEHRHTIEGDATGVPENMLRLSVGIENADDLIADLTAALSPTRR